MDPIKDIYDALKGTGLFVDEVDFRTQVTKSPKEVFDAVSSTKLFVNYDDFETQLGVKKKILAEEPLQPNLELAVQGSQKTKAGGAILPQQSQPSLGPTVPSPSVSPLVSEPLRALKGADPKKISTKAQELGVDPQALTSAVNDFDGDDNVIVNKAKEFATNRAEYDKSKAAYTWRNLLKTTMKNSGVPDDEAGIKIDFVTKLQKLDIDPQTGQTIPASYAASLDRVSKIRDVIKENITNEGDRQEALRALNIDAYAAMYQGMKDQNVVNNWSKVGNGNVFIGAGLDMLRLTDPEKAKSLEERIQNQYATNEDKALYLRDLEDIGLKAIAFEVNRNLNRVSQSDKKPSETFVSALNNWKSLAEKTRSSQINRYGDITGADIDRMLFDVTEGLETSTGEKAIYNVAAGASDWLERGLSGIWDYATKNREERLASDMKRDHSKYITEELLNYADTGSSMREAAFIPKLVDPEIKKQVDEVMANTSLDRDEKYKSVYPLIKNAYLNGGIEFFSNPNKGNLNLTSKNILHLVSTSGARSIGNVIPAVMTGGGASTALIAGLDAAAMKYDEQFREGSNDPLARSLRTGLTVGALAGIMDEAAALSKAIKGSNVSLVSKPTAIGAAKSFGTMLGKEQAEELTTEALDGDVVKNWKEVVLSTAIIAPIFAGPTAIIDNRRSSDMYRHLWFEAGASPELAKNGLNRMLNEGAINNTQFNEASKRVDRMAQIVANMPKTDMKGQPLSDSQKAKYADNLMKKYDAQSIPDTLPTKVAEQITADAQQADAENASILEGQAAPELSITEDNTTEQISKQDQIKKKNEFITDADFVQEAFTPEEDAADREALPESQFKTEEELSDFLANGQYAMLTGQNPEATPLSKEANRKLNEKAQQWLSSRGLTAVPIFGKYGNSERSFMVPNMTKQQAVEFAKEFQQESVAHSSGLVYQDGSFNPRTEGVDLSPRFNQGGDLFSTINVGGKKVDFSINYDFDQKISAPASISDRLRATVFGDTKSKVESAQKSLEKTGVVINMIQDPAEYDAKVAQFGGQRGTEGVFVSDQGQIFINQSKLDQGIADGRVIWHEASHPVVNIIRNTNRDLFDRVVSGLRQAAAANKGVADALAWAQQNYSEDGEGVVNDEAVVETIAGIADGVIDIQSLPTGVKQSIIEFINRIARALGLGQIISDTDVAAFKKVAGDVANALREGRDISQVVGESNVSRFENILAQERITAEDVLSKEMSGKMKVTQVATEFEKAVDSILDPSSDPDSRVSRFLQSAYQDLHYFFNDYKGDTGLDWYTNKVAEFNAKLEEASDIAIKNGEMPEANSLKNPENMGLFKVVLALSSIGVNPRENVKSAFAIWKTFDQQTKQFAKYQPGQVSMRTNIDDNKGGYLAPSGTIVKETNTFYDIKNKQGKIQRVKKSDLAPEYDVTFVDNNGNEVTKAYRLFKAGPVNTIFRKGPTKIKIKNSDIIDQVETSNGIQGKGWTTKGNIVAINLERVEKLLESKPSLKDALDWLNSKHPIAELREFNPSVPDVDGGKGKINPKGERIGSYIIGEKLGAFHQNVAGTPSELTMDLWWSRTWNRYMGTLMTVDETGAPSIQETPRTDTERNIMRQAAAAAAESLGLQVHELQAALWYLEQQMYKRMGAAVESYSFVDGINELLLSYGKSREEIQPERYGIDSSETDKRRTDAAARAADIIYGDGGRKGKGGDGRTQESRGNRVARAMDNVSNQMTEDGQGNYVFYHYSNNDLKKIDPSKFGRNIATGRDERPGVGLSMYYTRPDIMEANVPSDFGYVVRIPKDNVYPFNEDPLNLLPEAEKQFKKQFPDQAFDFNKQVGFVTKVAADRGYPMTVAEWNVGRKKALRAQTTESMKPEKFKEKVFEDGYMQEKINPKLDFVPNAKKRAQMSKGNRYLPATNDYITNIKPLQQDGFSRGEFGRNGSITWEIPESQRELESPNYLIIQSIDRNKDTGVATKEDSKGEGAKAIASLFEKYPSVSEILYDDYAENGFWQRIGGDKQSLKREDFFKYFDNKYKNSRQVQPSVGNRPVVGQINWQRSPEGKGDPSISARNKVVTQAAADLKDGKITNEEYRATVSENSPILPITRFFEPASEAEVERSLDKNQAMKANTPVADGTKVGLRLDIPAYKNNNTWVVSVHEGDNKAGKAISYRNVARITDVRFGVEPKASLNIAAGLGKAPINRIYGKWSNIPGESMTEQAENAKALVQEIVDDPNYVQVGMNPFRHSYFYDRNTDIGRPIVSADEVIQVGGLVYAKNPVYGEWTDESYRVKGMLDAAGAPVQFSKGNRLESSKDFKLAAFVIREKADGAPMSEIVSGIASVFPNMSPQEIKDLVDDPETWLRGKFSYLSKALQDNLISRAANQNITAPRSTSVDPAFASLEVPMSRVEASNKKPSVAQRIDKAVTNFKNNWIDPAKGLPDWVMSIKDFASGARQLEISRAVKAVEQLKAVAKEIGFTDWDAFSEAMKSLSNPSTPLSNVVAMQQWYANVAASGKQLSNPPSTIPAAVASLPSEIIPFVYQMRGQIDRLTGDLIGSGYVTPEQAVVLEKNLGAYVNRAYKMYNERGWKPAQDQVNEAIKFLADQNIKQMATENPTLTQDEVTDMAIEQAKKDVQSILDKKRNPFFGKTGVESRDLGILKERQDIPEPIRKLMGEYTDPGTVFVMTVAKQAALKASSEYLTNLRKMGMGSLFFEGNDTKRPIEASVKIASDGSDTLSPLNGLYTTPEVAEALQTVSPTYNAVTNAWMKAVGAVRWGKTVGSIKTQILNFESNLGFAVMNGLLLSGSNKDAFRAAGKYVKGQYSKAEIDELTEKVISLGLVNQGVSATELKEMLGSGDVHDIALDLALNPESKYRTVKKAPGKVLDVFNKLYRMGDDFWKVYAYMNERALISNAMFDSGYDSLTDEQKSDVDIEASERVKNTWPTYDRVFSAVKNLSKNVPILGNFVSFRAESIRVLTNTVKMAINDLKSGNAGFREMGAKRLAGIISYIGIRSAITYAAAHAAGVASSGIFEYLFGDDEEKRKKDALKKAAPPFMMSGDVAVNQHKDEPWKFTVVDLSSIDPYGVVFKSMNAFTEGRDGMKPGPAAAFSEFFGGFLDTEMTFETLMDAVNNIDTKTGDKIVGDTDEGWSAYKKVGSFVIDRLQPSTIGMVERLMGKNAEAEAFSLLGMRPYEIDLHKSFSIKMSDMAKSMEEISKEYNKIKFRDGSTKEDIDRAEINAESKKAIMIEKMNQMYSDFILLGADKSVLDKIVKERSSIKKTGFDPQTKRGILGRGYTTKSLFK